MAKEDLGKLSPAQLKKLGKVISEAKDLTNQQAEIIEKVLAGEEDIGKLRISYLEQYFDTYSKKLDAIARKHSALNDTFLVLDNKLNENYKALSSDLAKLEAKLKDLAKTASSTKTADDTQGTKKADNTSNEASEGGSSIQDILRALDGGVKLNQGQFRELLSKTQTALRNIKLDKTQYQTLLDKLSGTLIQVAPVEPSIPQQAVAETANASNANNSELTDAVLGVLEAADAGLAIQRSTMEAVFDVRDSIKSAAIPVDAPESIPVDAPTSIPVEAPTSIPVNVPASIPVNTPLSIAVEAPISIPVDAPLSIAVDAPEFIPVQAPASIPVEVLDTANNNTNVIVSAVQEVTAAVNQTKAAILNEHEIAAASLQAQEDTKAAVLNVVEAVKAIYANSTAQTKESLGVQDKHATEAQTLSDTSNAKNEQIQSSAYTSGPKTQSTKENREDMLNVYNLFQEIFDRSIPITQQTAASAEPVSFSLTNNITDMFAATTEGGSRSKKGSGKGGGAGGDKSGSARSDPTLLIRPVKVENTVGTELTDQLKESKKELGDFAGFLDGIVKDGISAHTQEELVVAAAAARKEKALEVFTQKEEAIRASMLELAIAKLQTQEELEIKSIELRLNRLKEATDAELAAQQLLSKIDSQLKPANAEIADKESGDVRARKVNADIDLKAYQELEKQLADYRAKLDLETQLKTGKRLTAAQAAANEKLARQRVAAEKDAIIKRTREELLAKEQLAQLSKTNPKVAQEYEKRIAEYREKLDRDAIIANNGILTEETAKANAWLAQEYAANNKEAILEEIALKQKLTAQLTAATKNDPSVAQEFERKIAEYKAQLDLESRRANNNILTDEAAAANEKLAQDYAAARRDALLAEIAAEQQFKAELAEASKTNAQAVHEFERQMSEAQHKLDREAMLANNGVLTQAAAEANAKAIREEYDARKDELLAEIALKQLAEEDLAKFRENNGKLANARETAMAKQRSKLELIARQQNNGILSEEEAKRIKELVDNRYELEGKEMEKLAKRQLEDDEKDAKRESRKQIEDVASAPLSKDNNLLDRFTVLSRATEDKVTNLGDGDEGDEKVAKAIAGLDTAMTLLSDLAKRLDGAIDKVGSFQGVIDTRLQGSSNKQHRGSYWGQLTRDMMSVGAVTPFFKQEDFANNIKSLVEKGISFDLKQRAFLMTIQEKIANTFNVADGTLLRLIRIQQEDSTAGRLGMESALNSFLNNMYETSEYLTDVAASVRSSLEEMESLMTGAAATEVEYQVQKWMGSLYSVGMSQNAVNAIASAIGQVASGQVEALTNGGAGNLIVMAANDADIPIADILTGGLDAEETNRLLQATVNYLAEIAEASKGNNVVQQQLANVFGVKASDLRAATNLAEPGSTGDIFSKNMTYDNMIRQLNNMAKTMGDRVSWGEKLTNIWQNGEYTLASSLANSPAAYLIYKLAGLLDDAVGGIALPFINVMGFGVDLNTTVADLMRVAAMTGGILSNLGPMVSGLANSFSGQAMLSKMGIGKGSGLEVVHRGKGDGVSAADSGGGSSSTSGSGYVGNSDGNSIKDSTIKESEDSKKKQMIEAKEEEPENQVDVLNSTVLKIYELLDNVASGSQTLRVRVDNYGLTGLANNNSSNSLSNNLSSTSSGAGVAGLGNDGSSSAGGSGVSGSASGSSSGNYSGSGGGSSFGGSGSGSGSGSSSGGSGGFGSSGPGSISLGGWTTI